MAVLDPIPAVTRQEVGGIHSGQVASPTEDTHPTGGNLYPPISLMLMSLDCRRKPK